MALRYVDNSRERIATDLYAFFEPHETKDRHFDEWCGWVAGRTREFLEKAADPNWHELIEICMRLAHPLGYYVQVVDQDGADKWTSQPPFECTAANPCCAERGQERDSSMPGGPIVCPHRCLCHT